MNASEHDELDRADHSAADDEQDDSSRGLAGDEQARGDRAPDEGRADQREDGEQRPVETNKPRPVSVKAPARPSKWSGRIGACCCSQP